MTNYEQYLEDAERAMDNGASFQDIMSEAEDQYGRDFARDVYEDLRD